MAGPLPINYGVVFLFVWTILQISFLAILFFFALARCSQRPLSSKFLILFLLIYRRSWVDHVY